MFKIIATALMLMPLMVTSSLGRALDIDLVISFFKAKSIKFGYVFDCFLIKGTSYIMWVITSNVSGCRFSKLERIEFSKILMEHQLRISETLIIQHVMNLTNNRHEMLQHAGIIVDGDCGNVDNFLKEANESLLFDDVHHWLIIASNNSFFTKFLYLNLNIGSDVQVATMNIPNEKIQNYTITDVYNQAYQHGGVVKMENTGFYNKRQGLQVKNPRDKFWARRNMTGVSFKTMFLVRQPVQESMLEEFLQCDTDRRVDPYLRFHSRLMHYCKDVYNFSWKISLTKSWGYEFEKGKFDGLSGALQRKEVDFGLSGLYVKEERIPILDFGFGFWTFKALFFFRQPVGTSYGQVFLHPMSSSVWLSTVAATIIILAALKLTQKYELNVLKPVSDSLDQTWSTLILFTLGAICQQGSFGIPALFCGRIITLSVLTFSLLFYQFYSGSIVSFLLTKPAATIKTPNDLLESSLRMGCDNAAYFKDYYRTTTDPMAKALFQNKIIGPGNTSNYYSPEYGLKLVEKGGFAYQVEVTAGYVIIQDTFSNKAICELGEIRMFPIKTIFSAFQKNSPFRDMFNYCFARLAEHGIGEQEKAHWGARRPICIESSYSVSFQVGLNEIYSAIVVLSIGILMSFILLGLELLMKIKSKVKYISKKQVVKSQYQFVN